MDGFTWVAKVDGTDIADLVLDGARIEYGRSSLDEQPGIPLAVLQLPTADKAPTLAASWPEFGLGIPASVSASGYTDTYATTYAGPGSRLTIGATVEVQAISSSGYTDTYSDTYAGETLTRFTGTVQAIDYEYETVTLTCLAKDESWARILVGDLDAVTTWPAETDIARAARIATDAGVTLQIDGAAGANVIARPAGSRGESALSLLQSLAIDCDALLYTDRAGVTHYRSSAYAGALRDVDLDADLTLLAPMRMSLELGLVRTQVTVEYGEPDATTNIRPQFIVQDTAQQAIYGIRDLFVSTQLADATSAENHANKLLAGLDPAWHMPIATVSFEHASDAQIGRIGNLEQGDTINLPALLPTSPTPDYTAICLGYTETLSGVDWQIEYHLSPSTVHV